jgi:hypothetical protein
MLFLELLAVYCATNLQPKQNADTKKHCTQSPLVTVEIRGSTATTKEKTVPYTKASTKPS